MVKSKLRIWEGLLHPGSGCGVLKEAIAEKVEINCCSTAANTSDSDPESGDLLRWISGSFAMSA